MKGLIIREPWIDMILDGTKTWELRTQRTSVRGEIALIRQGTGQIEGVTHLVDSLPPLDPEGLAGSVQFHGVSLSEQAIVILNGWLFPWLIVNTRRLSSPVPYHHPNGAVTWVSLDFTVTQSIARAKQGSNTAPSVTAPKVKSPPGEPRPTEAFNIPIFAIQVNERAGGTEAKISPALETELVATADRLGVDVKALGSNRTKMRRFTVPSRTGDQIVMVNRMARSSPRFQIFLAPSLDNRIAGEIASVRGTQRYVNPRTNDHKLSHSAFSVFKEPRSEGEPFGHGWLLEEHRAGEQFSHLIEVIRGQ
jgi:hypothetical protein